MSLKGGVGKTIISVHLAHYIHEQGQKVLLIDGDPKQGSKRWNARGPDKLKFDVTDEQVDWDPYDWVIIDSQAHPEERAIAEMTAYSNLVVIPTTINVESIEDAITLQREVRRFTKAVTLVNDVHPALTDGPDVRNQLRNYNASPLFGMVHRRKAYEYARAEGVAVPDSTHRDRVRAWLNFCTVAEEVLEHGSAR